MSNGREKCLKELKRVLTLVFKVNSADSYPALLPECRIYVRGSGVSGGDGAQRLADIIDDLLDEIAVVAFAHHAHHWLGAGEANH